MRQLLSFSVARLAAAIFLLQLLSSGATAYLLRAQMEEVVHTSRMRQVQDVRDNLLAAYYDGGSEELREYIAAQRGSAADPRIFVALTGNGAPVLSHITALPGGDIDGPPGAVRLVRAKGIAASEGLAMTTSLPDGSRLVVGASIATERRIDLAFAGAIALTLGVTAVLALIGALLLGYVISKRTHGIAATADALAAGNFTARVPQGKFGDGFDHLRRQMNLMAERIDTLVKQLRTVAGALAHDLQSPVARLRASIDMALAQAPGGPAGEALQLARSDAESLQAMLATALDLGRLESGTIEDRRQMLELSDVVSDMAELYEPLADQSGIRLTTNDVPVRVLADRELLSRALANLIDNALKYGGDRIELASLRSGPWAEIRVSDNGEGIASEDRERAVMRFTRLDNARTRPGAGLGLAMVSAVAQLHGGSLELSDSLEAGDRRDGGGGLVATIRLPLG